MKQNKTEERCVLRLFGARAEAVEKAAAALPGVRAQCASRGGETLVALCADKLSELEKAEKRLCAAFPCDLYGKGDLSLAAAAVKELERRERLLACADEAAGALLEPRLETVEGAARVFDFGSLSYSSQQARAKIEAQVRRRAGGKDAVRQELARVHAVLRVVGAELAAGCVKQENGVVLFVGTRKGCWLRAVREEENPGLWLLDMVRRAACGLKPAEETLWQRYRGRLRLPAPRTADKPSAPRKRRRVLRRALALMLLLALLGLGGAWYATGGDLAALPQTLGLNVSPHSGATLV